MFEIEFVDARTGDFVRRIVPTHSLARQLARDLAMASGRRAMVRRVDRRWRVLLVDCDTRNWIDTNLELSAKQLQRMLDTWKFKESRSVLVPWPADLPVVFPLVA